MLSLNSLLFWLHNLLKINSSATSVEYVASRKIMKGYTYDGLANRSTVYKVEDNVQLIGLLL